MHLRHHVPLAPRTTFGIGGPARYFVEAHHERDVRSAFAWAREKNIPLYLISGGSNILVPDAGLRGLVIKMAEAEFEFSGTELRAQAGCTLSTLITASADEALTGWERMAGIPGSIGGAVRGNAGAFGTEMKDVLTWVRAMNIVTEEIHEFSNAECEFSYRQSFFKKHPEWIILDTHIQLNSGKSRSAHDAIDETIAERERRHIQHVKAAGSYFMNPVATPAVCELFEQEKQVSSREGRVPAGWLIEKVGMRGARVRGAEASMQHPNYLMNAGGATAADVQELARQIKHKVRTTYAIELQEEAVIL